MTIANTTQKNVVVIGGSYSGAKAAKDLAQILPPSHRVILLEQRSHFAHLYVLPRFAVVPGYEDQAFIPYDGLFDGVDADRAAYIQARVHHVSATHVRFKRPSRSDEESLPFDYMIYAAGSRLPVPLMNLPHVKGDAIGWLKGYQDRIVNATQVLVAGGGALGIQFATDIKAWYPQKEVTLVNSRSRFMHAYKPEMHSIIQHEMDKLGIRVMHNERIIAEPEKWPDKDEPIDVTLRSGQTVRCDLPILCLGLQHNHELLSALAPAALDESTKALKVRPTLQLQHPEFDHIFVVGDVAQTPSIKAGHTGYHMAVIAAQNVVSMIEKRPLKDYESTPPRIKITLGKGLVVTQHKDDDGETKVETTTASEEHLDALSMWALYGARVDTQ